MKISFDIKDYISNSYLNKNIIRKLKKKSKNIIFNIIGEIKKPDRTLNILDDKFKFNFKEKELNKFKKYKTIALIGMGGSILGTEAINFFFKEKIKKKTFFFNDLDEDKVINFTKNRNLSKVLFIITSKSGNTIETLSNTFLMKIIKKNSKNIIIISERKNNFLYLLSKKFNLFYIEHKKFVGGRYSVLSEVGMVPAYIFGLKIKKLRQNLNIYTKGFRLNFLRESTIKLANILISKKFNNLIFLNYAPELEKFLFWSQQLIAESLGKKNIGFLPVISSAPKDHHSLLQLYLDGPKDKIFYIFSHEKRTKKKIKISKIFKNTNFLDNKNFNTVKIAQKNALIKTLKKKNIPFREFKIKSRNEETVGALFSYFILETIILGRLLNINPFDQPAVEQVKVFTKKLLS